MATHPPALVKKARKIGKGINALSLVAPQLAAKLALKIFITPRKNPVSPKQVDFVKTAAQKDLILQKHRIRCFEWQPKTAANGTVLLIHGWASSTARWSVLIRALLKENYIVKGFDAPAHGFSSGKTLNLGLYAQVVRDYVEQEGAPTLLVGHSIGAAASVMSMTRFEGQRPEKMALLAGFTDSMRVMQDFTTLLALRPSIEEAMDLEIKRLFGERMQGFSLKQLITELSDVQGMVVHDKQDEIAPFVEGQYLAEHWKNAEFLATEGLGHSLQAKEIYSSVLSFAKK